MKVQQVEDKKNLKYLRSPDEKDRLFPKNKKVEIVFLVEAVNAILPRTEGVEDITLMKLAGTDYEVPVILPEKLQAVTRRKMLAQLRKYKDLKTEELGKHLERLVNVENVVIKDKKGNIKEKRPVSFVKARKYVSDPKSWNCFIQPSGGETREKATDIGMDGFCPACVLFGAVLDKTHIEIIRRDKKGETNVFGEAVGIKSRVEFDPAFAISDQAVSVASYTHNKVADGVSWTGQSLFTEQHVVAGTIFVGRVVLEDVTETELKAFLAVLSAIDRLGGRERVFGTVRIHLLGIKGGSYETVSAYELARELAKEYGERLLSIDEVKEKLKPKLEKLGFETISEDDYKKLLDNMELWDKLWEETTEFDRQVIRRILDILGAT